MTLLKQYWKALAGALGGLTATHVDWITQNIFQVDLSGELDAAIAVIIAAGIVALFPRNKQPVSGGVESGHVTDQ